VHGIAIDIGTALALFLSLAASLEIGYRSGRRASFESDARATGQVGAIQGAVLGLLGLLLGFSFAAAGSRFLERQQIIVHEANAIGTAVLRADLLDPPFDRELVAALEEYTAHRLDLATRIRTGLSAADRAEIDRLHQIMWKSAVQGVEAKPVLAVAVLNPVNDVIDTHTTRVAAGRMHLPVLVTGLLIGCSFLALGVIGYGCGLAGHRRLPLTGALVVLVGTSLWVTIDLDHPRAGLLQLSDAPLQELTFDQSDGPAPTPR
jgi:hypothetical protein